LPDGAFSPALGTEAATPGWLATTATGHPPTRSARRSLARVRTPGLAWPGLPGC